MVTRNLRCPECGHTCERIALGMGEPPHDCEHCDAQMEPVPSFPTGVKFIGEGFHSVDYPKSADQKAKDYGYEDRLSTSDRSSYHEEGPDD